MPARLTGLGVFVPEPRRQALLPGAQLRDLADTALLARLRTLAKDSPERAVI
jgi:hypothetical protein